MPTDANRVLVVSPPLYEQKTDYYHLLMRHGLQPVFPPRFVEAATEEDLIEWLADDRIVAVIAGGEPYTRRVIERAAGLRVISRAGVGSDSVDVAAAAERGITVTITPNTNHEAVAEHTFALLLAVARQVVRRDREVRTGRWSREPLTALRGRTLGLIGFGRIGQAVAERAAAFGLRTIAYDTFPNRSAARRLSVALVELDELLAEADFISLHTPLTEATSGMINRHTLAKMKRGVILINTARGGLIVEEDLVEALRDGHVAGAGLDVFVQEPPAEDSPLLQFDTVVLSPHVAGIDEDALYLMAVGAAWNIIDVLAGRCRPEVVVPPPTG